MCSRFSIGNVYQDGLVPIRPVRSISETSFPNKYVYPQVPARSKRFTALHFVLSSKQLQRAGDRVDMSLVLINLRPCSGTDACMAGVDFGCTIAVATNCSMLHDPHESPHQADELCCWYDTE